MSGAILFRCNSSFASAEKEFLGEWDATPVTVGRRRSWVVPFQSIMPSRGGGRQPGSEAFNVGDRLRHRIASMEDRD